MKPSFSQSRRKFLCNGTFSSLAVLIGNHALAGAAPTEIHVSAARGDDAGDGSVARPFKTIGAAAAKAMPGSTITVHAGVYREWVKPPRGGDSDQQRIVYQAAKGEKVVITGSDAFTNWERVSGNVWKVAIPNSRFGAFNPYAERVYGDWFNDRGNIRRRGNVYLAGEWLPGVLDLETILKPEAQAGWFSVVDGFTEEVPAFLMNVARVKIEGGAAFPAEKMVDTNGPKAASGGAEGDYATRITNNAWMLYGMKDFGAGAENVEIVAAAAAGAGGIVEVRAGHYDGELLGKAEVLPTGDWQQWKTFNVKIKKTSGEKKFYLVFRSNIPNQAGMGKRKPAAPDPGKFTTVYVNLPSGVDPNSGAVEVCMRPTVFTPERTNINYITVRGFDLRNAATNWAAPTVGQIGLVSAYWNKGWIIEDNEISYSRCSGIALGKYSDEWDGLRGTTEGYFKTIEDALGKGAWSKENIGGHIVRNNHIHHCGQTGIVGSMGCAFSRIEGNDIHDCATLGIWSGAEMAGVKFHGAIDVVIADNHIHHNGGTAGIWLDWMAQGVRVTGNLFHDNQGQDLNGEVNHGPILVANNLFMSKIAYRADSQGVAFAHNLVAGTVSVNADGRRTPYMKAHSTERADWHPCPLGDDRWHNNLLGGSVDLSIYDKAAADFPCTMSGNVFTNGARRSRFDTGFVLAENFDCKPRIVKKSDGWYLSLTTDPAWGASAKRQLVTTATLGKAKIPQQEFTQPDGAAMAVDRDFHGTKRNASNVFPGPFALPLNGEVKVWPKPAL